MTRIVFLDRSTMAPHIPLTKPSFLHEWIEHDRTRPDQIVDNAATTINNATCLIQS